MAVPPRSLQVEQEETLGLLRSAASSSDPELGEKACRRLLALTELREVVVHPSCVDWADPDLVDDAATDCDLLRLVAGEILSLPSEGLMRKAWLRAAIRLLEGRVASERSEDGLWAGAPNDMRALDIRIREHLPYAFQRAEAADEAWSPLTMESQRPFQPPAGAVRW